MITWKRPNLEDCAHAHNCSCPTIISGVAGTPLASFGTHYLQGTLEEQRKKVVEMVMSRYRVVNGQIVPSMEDDMKEALYNRIAQSPNMKKVPPPIRKKADFLETPPYEPPLLVREAYKYCDKKVLPQYFKGYIDWGYLYSDLEDLDDFHNEVRKRSAYWTTFGKINGRPFRIPALQNAAGMKTINAVMGYSRNTRELNQVGKEAVRHVNEAMRRMYACMGYTPDQLGVERSVISFTEVMDSAFLGSASGLNKEAGTNKVLPTGEPIIITTTGKKIDMLQHDFDRIMDYLEKDIAFETYWTQVGKVENYFSWSKQMEDNVFAQWIQKLRLFCIPTSTFVLAEKLVSKIRMMKERGKMILIGFKWPHGGADILAKCLSIDAFNEFKKILVEGDLKNMDQTVHAYFVELYMNMMLVHETPGTLDYDLKVKLLKYLVPRMVERLTRLYSDVWVLQYGGVPSGCYNTSHMDSWIMGLYFFLFCTIQLHNAPEEDKEDLDELISQISAVFYGDDHLYNKGDSRVSFYLSGYNFQTFLKRAFDVDLKDIFDGVSFLSSVDRGRIVKRGACFLKQFFYKKSSFKYLSKSTTIPSF